MTEFAKVDVPLIFLVQVPCFGADNERGGRCRDVNVLGVESGNRHAQTKLPVLFDQLGFRRLNDIPLRLQPIVEVATVGATSSLKNFIGPAANLFGDG